MRKLAFLAVVLFAGVAALAVASHFKTVGQLEARIQQLEAKVLTAHSQSESALAASKAARRSNSAAATAAAYDDSNLNLRVADAEDSIVELRRATDYLMEHGQIPLADRKIEELAAKLADGTLPDAERLNALRLLRRGRALSDTAATSAVNWLQVAATDDLKREILRGLENATNGVIKQPMLAFADNPNNALREQAFENLQSFVNDPAVEQMLWAKLQTETDPRARQEIIQGLTRGDATPERIASLQARAQNPTASMEERLLALQALRGSRTEVQQIVASFAATAQSTQDPNLRAQIFGAFDGIADPTLKVPLVYGLQDGNAQVRARAADALSNYANDPAVQQWLRYVVDNDSDPRVRREAMQALEEGQRRGGPQGQGQRRN
ncbi:MAG TPA: HEAT repeat domain-containing protein [Verrucomicrobiae bacterium]